MQERITLTIENNVAHVELNRPGKHNALDLEMYRAVAAVQKRLRRIRSLRAVVLSGAGEDFCSGIDIKSVMKDRAAVLKLLWKWLPWQSNLAQVVSTGWRDLPVPVIACGGSSNPETKIPSISVNPAPRRRGTIPRM